MGEAVLRLAGGYRLFATTLELKNPKQQVTDVLALAPEVVAPFVADWTQRRPDLDAAWLPTSPPPLPEPEPAPAD